VDDLVVLRNLRFRDLERCKVQIFVVVDDSVLGHKSHVPNVASEFWLTAAAAQIALVHMVRGDSERTAPQTRKKMDP
jgi:hypothetical protein